jgi:chaperone BCS1
MSFNFFDQLQATLGFVNAWITQTLHGNSMVAGAVTASIVGSLFYVLRRIPKRVWNRIERYVFFTYELEFGRRESSSMINAIAGKFEYELQKRVSGKRASARIVTRHKRLTESLSDGSFFYRYQGAWMYISRVREKPAAGQTTSPRDPVGGSLGITLSMTALRYNRKKILTMLGESAKEYSVPGVYQLRAAGWSGDDASATRVRNFTTLPVLAIDDEVKAQIDEAIDNFLAEREHNNQLDLPHKLTIMLYGEPGTGKSALGEYVAFRLGTSLFCANAASTANHNNIGIPDAIRAARDNIIDTEVPVVLFDDIDTIWNGIQKRKMPKAKPKAVDEDDDDSTPALVENTVLGRILTALQSPVEINDCVGIFTTNHLEKIDPALYRPGRMTLLIEVGRMKPKSVMEYFEKQYGQAWPEHTPIERALRACDINAFHTANRRNPQGFVAAVTSEKLSADEVFNAKSTATV